MTKEEVDATYERIMSPQETVKRYKDNIAVLDVQLQKKNLTPAERQDLEVHRNWIAMGVKKLEDGLKLYTQLGE